jgi:hypothetical protein
MGSKRRLRRKGCESKRRYVSMGEAQVEANRARVERREQDIEPYLCDFCNGWHIGHRPGAGRDYIDRYRVPTEHDRRKQ